MYTVYEIYVNYEVQKSSKYILRILSHVVRGSFKHLLDMVFEGFCKIREVMPRCLWFPCIIAGMPINEIRVGSWLIDSKAAYGKTPVFDLVIS